MKDAEQPKFIHLRCHSEYSVTDGIVKIEEYLNQALEVDMPALALTDLSNLFGFPRCPKRTHHRYGYHDPSNDSKNDDNN